MIGAPAIRYLRMHDTISSTSRWEPEPTDRVLGEAGAVRAPKPNYLFGVRSDMHKVAAALRNSRILTCEPISERYGRDIGKGRVQVRRGGKVVVAFGSFNQGCESGLLEAVSSHLCHR